MAPQKLIPVSVIVTVFNEEKTIVALVEALHRQTHQAAEIIIVDGGSSDATLTVLQSLIKENGNLKVFTKPGNRSVGRNYAIENVTSDVIAITDAGCVPHPDWLEQLVATYSEAVQNSDQKIVVAGYYDAKPSSAFEEAVLPYVFVMPDRVNPEAFLPATRSMLLEKSVWREVGGFDESLSDNEDYALAKKIASQPQKFKIVFSEKAKVTWLPRTSLRSFSWMIYRFARGDMKAGIIRPKVVIIFVHYIFMAVLLGGLLWLNLQPLFWFFLIAHLFLYSTWSILKNLKYVPHGWYWLPVLQHVSDVMVISGSVCGLLSKFKF